MRMTGRWVRRGSTVVVFGIDDGKRSGLKRAPFAGPGAFEVAPVSYTATSRPTLRRGATGSAVVDLQTRLRANGYDVGALDGIFGARTEAAVRSLQQSRGLIPDGIVGSQTWSALDASGRVPAGSPPPASQPPVLAPPSSGSLDPAIESLNLAEPARSAAYFLKSRHPWVVFTSGRRDAARQASAMAGNVVKDRRWIARTYSSNPVSMAAQAWVDAHPEARTQQAIADGLLGVFKQFSPRDLGRLSYHLSGLAFDVKPVPSQEGPFWKTVLGLPGLREHFSKEGDLIIWHVGF
jgi:peptidoglycan hydrolase-like protein with peptidoglycan-binding domain